MGTLPESGERSTAGRSRVDTVKYYAQKSRFAGPSLSPSVTNFLKSDLFRIIAVFLIAYMSNKNFQVALILSIGLVTTLNFIDKHNMFEGFN